MDNIGDFCNERVASKGDAVAEVTSLSDFKLPEKVRKLAVAVYEDLLIPCGRSLSIFEEKLNHARQLAESSRTKEEKRIQQNLRRVEVDCNEAERTADELRVLLRKIYEQAVSHISKFSKETSPRPAWIDSKLVVPPNLVPSLPPSAELCRKAQEFVKKAESASSQLLVIEIPTSIFPTQSLTGLLFCFALVTAVAFAKVVENIVATPIIGIPLYLLCVWTCRTQKQAKFNLLITEISDAGENAMSCLNQNVARSQMKKRQIEEECKTALKEAVTRHETELAATNASHATELKAIKEKYCALAEQFHNKFSELAQQAKSAGWDWNSGLWQDWHPHPSLGFAARIGTFTCFSEKLQKLIPEANWCFRLPALIPFSGGRCLLLNTTGKAKDVSSSAMQSVLIRVLATTPPGKARFTLIDPIGLGHNVADLLPLGDFDSALVNGKAWTEPNHIEQQLAKLTEDMEKVIQTYLRKDYTSLLDYNADHPELAEPFRFLVIFDFPANFTESAARRLTSIIKNGPRCGIYTLLLRDTAKSLPYDYNIRDLEENAFILERSSESKARDSDSFDWPEHEYGRFQFSLDPQPPPEITRLVIQKSGSMAAQGMKRVVSFERILSETQIPDSWRATSTADNLRVAIGPAGKGKPQELLLGSGQDAHALLVGRTGSGKTNLMHVIITGLALRYSPAELQLYLIDFKGGVGFKRYAESRLPHAKVIAIESEREFGLSVLRGLDAELKRRSEIFRSANVDNLSAYRAKASNGIVLPRILLIVDEFQELFVENDDLAQQSKLIFDRLARQGRSFGIHFLLATQSLAGPAQLPASIMGQVKVRIALACTETDSRMILAEDNKAARSLSQPGEAIYNPMGGLVEGNSPFQVALFSEEHDLHKYLGRIGDMAREYKNCSAPIVFEGNELARTEDCEPLNALLNEAVGFDSKGVDLFLGEPIAIQPPVTARLRRQSGSNLLIIAREEIEGVGVCVASLVSILAQHRPEFARIYVADFTMADSEWAEHAEEIAVAFPGDTTVVSRQREIGPTLATIAKEVQVRSENPERRGSIFIVFQGLHRIKALRENMEDDDGNNAVELLQQILRDGPELGIHAVAWADTLPNVTRGLGRKVLAEFGLRVGAVMSTDDSMNLLDSLAGSKISKPHRAIFVDEDRPGQPVSFRPYAIPSAAWLKETGQRLRNRIPNTTI